MSRPPPAGPWRAVGAQDCPETRGSFGGPGHTSRLDNDAVFVRQKGALQPLSMEMHSHCKDSSGHLLTSAWLFWVGGFGVVSSYVDCVPGSITSVCSTVTSRFTTCSSATARAVCRAGPGQLPAGHLLSPGRGDGLCWFCSCCFACDSSLKLFCSKLRLLFV